MGPMRNLKSFSQYVTEQSDKEITVAWGRANPPTVDHGLLFDKVASIATGKNYRIYVSQSQDPKRNPLDYETKVKYLRKMFPRHARNIILDRSVRTFFDLLSLLYNEGYTSINFVAGSDRVPEYDKLLHKYNGVSGRHGYYNFDEINVVSAGERDPDSEGVAGMSASKLREAAKNNDFQAFSAGMPSGFKQSRQLFSDIRKAMGLNESQSFRKHIQFKPISEKREDFISGSLFNVGDDVIIIESEEHGKIHSLGANYVIVEKENGKKSRQWIDAVETVSKNSKRVSKEETEVDRAKDRAEREKEALKQRQERDIERAKERDKEREPTDEALRNVLKNALKERFINEVMSADDSPKEWIKDFQKSDAPQFKGKSKEERKKMALAAYYAAQKESIDERVSDSLTYDDSDDPRKISKRITSLPRILQKIFRKTDFNDGVEALRKEVEKDKERKHSLEYHAQQIIRKSTLDLDARDLANFYRKMVE